MELRPTPAIKDDLAHPPLCDVASQDSNLSRENGTLLHLGATALEYQFNIIQWEQKTQESEGTGHDAEKKKKHSFINQFLGCVSPGSK